MTSPRRLSMPGKVFLLGEYSVLAGVPAWVAAVGPHFELLKSGAAGGGSTSAIHPESPAGRLIEQFQVPSTFQWIDPWSGAGGFGASTALFALIARAYQIAETTAEIWKLYRKLASFNPSGADLIAQCEGGVQRVEVPSQLAATNGAHEPRFQPMDPMSGHWVIFSASHQFGRKANTHRHLADEHVKHALLPQSGLIEDLGSLMRDAESARERRDISSLGLVVNQWGDRLQRAGLQIPATADDRRALQKIPGVVAVKGAGAGQADALVVLMESTEPSAIRPLVESATLRDLRRVEVL